MFRWTVFTLVLTASGVAAAWMLAPNGNSASATQTALPSDAAPKKEKVVAKNEQAPAPRTPSPTTATTRRPQDHSYRNNDTPGLTEPVVIADCPLTILEKQEVASEKEGVIDYIGTEVQMGVEVPPDKQLPLAESRFLAIAVGDKQIEGEDCWQIPNDPKWYRRALPSDPLHPTKVFLFPETRRVRKLQVGDRVLRGQLLAQVNPVKAFDDVSVKIAKLDAVEFARQSAHNQKEEYEDRLRRYNDSNRSQLGTIPLDQLMETRLQLRKAESEEKVKRAEIVEAQRTLSAAVTDLNMHEIRAAIDGVVKEIYKNHQGDAVKPYEPILRIENPKRLRVEGRLDVQEALKLKEGMVAIVEATRPESPRHVLSGHLGPVNCVAVSKGKRPIVVSGSDDGTLRGWDPVNGKMLWDVPTAHSSVRAVACTPPTSKHNLACFGCADGTVRVLDLDEPEQLKPREMAKRHRGPVLAVAFSPDGEAIATGGNDKSICLWRTETGKLIHSLRLHSGPVTWVQFASAERMVSAGTDKRLIVWDMENKNGPQSIDARFYGRGGQVSTLGIHPKDKTVLFDQGQKICLLTLESQQMVGFLQNPSGGMNFSTMAMFSPDGKTILTGRAGLAHEKLQLWRTPTTGSRGSELRQFIWKSTATCGAFAPEDSSFAVTGTQDHQVLVWSMPCKEEIETENRLEARLTLVENYLETQNREVRVWAELESPEWLFPGMRATLVVKPQRGK